MSKVILSNISKSFKNFIAIDRLNLTIEEAKFISFLGPSGCGKTTLLRMIAGLTEPTQGEIRIGKTLAFSDQEKISVPPEKRNIGMVFQSYALWPHMSVFQNVAYPLKIKKISKSNIKEKVYDYLKLVQLEGLESRFPHELSGGQQQRISLARALIREPELLLLDEPLSNLDAKLRHSMRFEIKEIQRRLKITTVYVTHDQQEALAMSDVIVLINKGNIEQIDSPTQLIHFPKTEFVKDFLSNENEVSTQS